MKHTLLSLILLITIQNSFSQKLKLKEDLTIHIATKASPKFPVMYINKKETKNDTVNVVYNKTGDTISFQLKKKNNWKEANKLDSKTANNNGITKFNLKGEVTPKDNRLIINFYPFENNSKAKTFLNNNNFSIIIPPRLNLGFKYSRFHAGTLSMPLKIYLNSRGENNNNNIETGANIGVYLGYLSGTKRFVKIPSEEEYRVYEYGWSINGFFGLNKLEITDKNTLDVSSFQGSLLTSSLGVNIGWHYKVFSIFGAIGFDIPLSDNGKDWYFKGKPWVGFGVGFEIF